MPKTAKELAEELKKTELSRRTQTDMENLQARRRLDAIKQSQLAKTDLTKKPSGDDEFLKRVSKEIGKLEEQAKKGTTMRKEQLLKELTERNLVNNNKQLKEAAQKTNNTKLLFHTLLFIKAVEVIKHEQEAKHSLLLEKQKHQPAPSRKARDEEESYPIEQGEKEALEKTEKALGGFLNNMMEGAELGFKMIERFDPATERLVLKDKAKLLNPAQYLQDCYNTNLPKPTPGNLRQKEDEPQQNVRRPSAIPNPGETPQLKKSS